MKQAVDIRIYDNNRPSQPSISGMVKRKYWFRLHIVDGLVDPDDYNQLYEDLEERLVKRPKLKAKEKVEEYSVRIIINGKHSIEMRMRDADLSKICANILVLASVAGPKDVPL